MKKIISIIFCGVFQIVAAQDLKVEGANLEDNRGSGGFSRCELTLSVSGTALGTAKLFRLDTALRVTDDKGNKLVNKTYGFDEGDFEEVKLDEGTVKKELHFSNPSRHANRLTAEGELEIYNPGLDPKSKLAVRGFTNKPNQTLLVEKNPNLDVFFIDQQAYQFLQSVEKDRVNKQIALLMIRTRQRLRYLLIISSSS